MESLVLCAANYLALTPVRFLERAAHEDGDRVSVVYGSLSYTWRETYERCLKLASALCQLDISRGDIVAAMAPNISALYELHFGVPMAGAVLSPLNPRLDTATLAMLLDQLDAKIIFVDYQYAELVQKSVDTISKSRTELPILVIIPELEQSKTSLAVKNSTKNVLDYNSLLSMGQKDFEVKYPDNDCDPITVNFTSGSTGTPKGVVYSHRATYLNSLAQISRVNTRGLPVFLWTVDMFRCNGWCFTWAMAALGGTNVCLRNASAKTIFNLVSLHNVTHLCGAPLLLNLIADAPHDDQKQLPNPVDVIIAGAFPPRKSLMKIEELGFNIIHGYGMTEALGPVIYRPWKLESINSHSTLIKYSCEGIQGFMVDVKDPKTMKSVSRDGKTMGEVMFRGNTLMMGYFKNPKLTQEAFKGGWFRTGDIGTKHPNGYIEMKDRIKDMIVSNGDQAISTLEIESVIISHPMVKEVAVVGKSYNGYGEKPCAFVKLKEGSDASAEEIIKFCEDGLPQDIVPRWVIFGDLPVNSTGKIQKFILRKRAKSLDEQSTSKRTTCNAMDMEINNSN